MKFLLRTRYIRGVERVRIRLLGGFGLEYQTRPLPPIPGVGRSLFAYLATYPGLPHTRDLLAGTFWPDEAEPAARRRLSQTLWQIQTALQEVEGATDIIISTAGEIAIDPDAIWVDVGQFDALMSSASGGADTLAEISDLTAAIDLYRGDFLAGFYDEWAEVERQRLRTRYLEGLWRLVALHKSSADYETSLAFARRLTLHDPLREEAHREVMRLCFLLGRSNEALVQYERCAQVMKEELGTEPDSETRRLRSNIAELRDKGERPFAPTSGAPLLSASATIPLVGRVGERRRLLKHFEDALLQRGGVVFVEGPSGIGKTRLMEEVADDAQWRGLSLMRAECREEEQLQAYGTLRAALESGLSRLRAEQLGALLHRLTLADLARVVPRLREWLPALPEPIPEEAEAGSARLHRAIAQTLYAMADLNPSVLMIDDAQWADEASLQLLVELAPEIAGRGLLLYLSYRDADARERTEVWAHLVAINDAGRADKLTIVPFDLTDSTRLIEESLGVVAVPGDTAEGLFLETGGNPLLLLETLRTWHAETHALTMGEAPTAQVLEPISASGGIAQVVSRRFAGLDDASRSVLEAVAVIGRVSDPAVVATITKLDRVETLRALDVLMGRGALVETAEGYTFAHHQVRTVTLGLLDPQRKSALHGAAAAEIERREPERVDTLALHYAEAGIGDAAADYAIRAGDRALGLAAFDAAARHYRSAAMWVLEGGRFDVLMRLEAALDVLGHRQDQRDVLTQAAGLLPDHPELARRLARLEDREGNHLKAIPLAESAVESSAGSARDVRRGALSTLGLVLSHAGRHTEAVPYLEKAVELSDGDLLAEASALCDLGNVYGQAQVYDVAAVHLGSALDRYGQAGDLFGTVETSGELAIIHMEQGDTTRAAELYEAALGIAREVGHQRAVAVNLNNLGNARYVQGDLAAALEAYAESTELFEALGDYRGAAILRMNLAEVRHTMLGDQSVEADIRRSMEFFQAEEHGWGEASCRDQLAAFTFHKGRVGEARLHIRKGIDLLERSANQWVEVHLRRTAAEIELAEGDFEAASDHVDVALSHAKELGLADLLPSLLSLEALVALARGDSGEATRLASEATNRIEKGTERAYVIWYRRHFVADVTGSTEDAAASLDTALAQLEGALASLDTPTRDQAMRLVPEHRAIVEARDRSRPQVAVVSLPATAAPSGRPLRDDEWVEVEWTLSTPADATIASPAERRRSQLVRLVEEAAAQEASVRVTDLAGALDVSVATVRRDLATLRDQGHPIVTRRGH